MDYRELAPPPELAPWVECGWSVEARERGENRILPDGCIDVMWSPRNGVHVVGTMTRALVVDMDADSSSTGIRFLPGAAPALLGLPAHELNDERVAPSELLGDEGRRLEDDAAASAAPLAVLRRWVARRAARSPVPDPMVRAAVERIAAGRPLDDLCASERHLRRRMTAEVGYGPKRLARVLRLRRALAVAPTDGLAAAALEAGYADQSHFTNDCSELAGLPPGRFLQDAAA